MIKKVLITGTAALAVTGAVVLTTTSGASAASNTKVAAPAATPCKTILPGWPKCPTPTSNPTEEPTSNPTGEPTSTPSCMPDMPGMPGNCPTTAPGGGGSNDPGTVNEPGPGQDQQSFITRTPTTKTATIRYGAFNLPAFKGGSGEGAMFDRNPSNIQKPCTNCYITSATPNLVYADGSVANVNTGPMLHHFVMVSSGEKDQTCTALGAIGQRFWASGNERTILVLPKGVGYYVKAGATWNMTIELMNMAQQQKTVYLQVTYTYEPASANLTKALPQWLDVNGCMSSPFYNIPAGPTTKSYTWTEPTTGRYVYFHGHEHSDSPTNITSFDTTQNKLICSVNPVMGGTPESTDPMGMAWISKLPICFGDNIATVSKGDKIKISASYNSPKPANGVMGIMIAYIVPS